MAKNTGVFGIVVGIILVLAVGCGTVDANMHITYTDGGNLQDELTLRCTGVLANYVLTPELKDVLVNEGWKVTTDVTNEATTLTATARRKQAAGSTSSPSVTGLASGLVVTEGGNFFVKTYTVDFTSPAREMASPEEIDSNEFLSQEDMEQMIETMFRMSVSITLPGKVVDSNADNVQGDTATWYYTYKGLRSERRLLVRSERTLWANIALTAVGGVVGLALIAFCAFRLRRSKTPPIAAVADALVDGDPL